MFDLIISGATVVDGLRKPRYEADVGVKDGVITAIGRLEGLPARKVLDVPRGSILAPGFIDAHTHDDEALLSNPAMRSKISQGVTTVVTGNCGISAAPMKAGIDLPPPLTLVEGSSERFPSFREYLDALRQAPPAVNVVALVGHTTLRVLAMTDIGRAADADEIGAMKLLLEECLAAGAFGMSSGTYYPPAAAATEDEIVAVGAPLKAHRALYVAHMRNEAEGVMEALEETFRISAQLGARVIVSHHKVMREANFGRSTQTLQRIGAEMNHQCVGLDCYPYTASSSMLHVAEERLVGRIVIASSEPHPELQGRELQQIADGWGVSRLEAARRLQPATAVVFSMSEEDVQRILAFDETMVGSDGLHVSGQPHPRLWGTFPRVLGRYSRDLRLFPLETAIWKMTGLAATTFGLPGRGSIQLGAHADIVLFDPDTIIDVADYESPEAECRGILAVIVNGKVAMEDGSYGSEYAGQILARGGD